MSFLDRLKNVFSGGEGPEKKDQAAKSETEKPPVEKETAIQETAEEKPKTETPATEEESSKTTTAETQETEKAKKSEPDTETKEEVKPEMAEAEEPVKAKDKPKKERSESMTLLQTDENLITRADVDEDFKQEIMDAGAESVAICFQCGTCTGACPSGRRTPYRIRGVVRRAVMGLKEDVISDDSIWMCTTCYECQERCPRGIKIVDIVKIIRNQAAAAGYMAPAHKMTGLFVTKTGHGVPINDATMALRKSVGLDELPPTTHQFPEALEEVQTIIKATGFDNLIGYNWETGELE
ncbi:CoB--CoM heterodisulfide reductase subunit C [Methanobacterium sp.]|uniref:CoB--CoM heterodisulfide reductase subunit C n=1 Tax=Methanobacterium sp. TaxID=2164 RepID=UPI0025E116CF|nr:CoB--CoM heterodisulfide reductase subunit C [Methanobacterium sp.]MBI5458168.1 CoB--CoM heterodisulfide reductase subunit C [Methanobacterium sp.]MDY9922701.1 CoB--CoM heterodisulfide reductase subunit C [Methanobacterium sp.]